MRKLPWAALGLFAAAAMANVVFVGCGSEDSPIGDAADGSDDGATNNSETGAGDGGADGATSDGGRAEAGACTATAAACTKSTECCTANCDVKTGKCVAPNTVCGLPSTTCTTGNQCCTGSCIGGTCSNLQCVADNAACGTSAECCGQNCASGLCSPLGTKPTSGNPCTMNLQCASSFCNNGVCANPSFCTVTGDICSTDAQCCGGLCTKAAGAAVGICGSVTGAAGVVGGPCLAAGELCSPNGTCTGADCCSRSCAPSPTSGLGLCQPESGCHLIGDLCTTTTECCGVKDLAGSIKGGGGGPSADVQCQKAAGQTFGVCNYVATVCSPAGALCKPGNVSAGGALSCSTKADCCAGNDNQFPTCQIDTNGIPRCTVTPDLNCANGKPAAGTQCASSADCCGDACLPNTGADQATKPYVCGGAGVCQAQGLACTANADCCKGLPCAIPPGAASGVCGGTLLPDGGVSTTPPAGTDGGVVQPADSGADAAATAPTCALYGQSCAVNDDCCSGVPCTGAVGAATCHFP